MPTETPKDLVEETNTAIQALSALVGEIPKDLQIPLVMGALAALTVDMPLQNVISFYIGAREQFTKSQKELASASTQEKKDEA